MGVPLRAGVTNHLRNRDHFFWRVPQSVQVDPCRQTQRPVLKHELCVARQIALSFFGRQDVSESVQVLSGDDRTVHV